MNWLVGVLAQRTDVCCDDIWLVDSTPVEGVRSQETVEHSEMAGWAEYRY